MLGVLRCWFLAVVVASTGLLAGVQGVSAGGLDLGPDQVQECLCICSRGGRIFAYFDQIPYVLSDGNGRPAPNNVSSMHVKATWSRCPKFCAAGGEIALSSAHARFGSNATASAQAPALNPHYQVHPWTLVMKGRPVRR